MQKSTLTIYAGLIGTLLIAGCAKQQQYKAVEQICVPQGDKAVVMETAEAVLSKMHFAIDKADVTEGVIRTRPLPAAQFFEFWRKDNAGSFNSAEANLHSIQRTAQLNISPQAGQLCITCSVDTQRLNLPAREVTSSTNIYNMFSRSKPLMQRLKLAPGYRRDAAWVDLGRDAALETKILKNLEKRLTGLKK